MRKNCGNEDGKKEEIDKKEGGVRHKEVKTQQVRAVNRQKNKQERKQMERIISISIGGVKQR